MRTDNEAGLCCNTHMPCPQKRVPKSGLADRFSLWTWIINSGQSPTARPGQPGLACSGSQSRTRSGSLSNSRSLISQEPVVGWPLLISSAALHGNALLIQSPLFGAAVAGIGLVLCFVAWAQESEAAPCSCSWTTAKSHPSNFTQKSSPSASHEYRTAHRSPALILVVNSTACQYILAAIPSFHFIFHTLSRGLSCRP